MYNQAQVGFDVEHYNCHKPTNALCFKSHIGSSKHFTWKLELQRRDSSFDNVTNFKLTCFTAALKAPRIPAAPPQSLFIPSMDVYPK